MSKFKRALSAFLAIALVLGSLSCLGAVVAPKASAAEGTSKIDSYDSLAAAYDNFVYFGTEFYEIDITVNADGTYGEAKNHKLTDYYVDAGQILEARLYVKSDMYMGEGIFIMLYENDFFDVKQLTSALPANASTGYSQGQNGGVNKNHPAYKINGIKGQQTSGNTNTINWMKQRTGYTADQLEAWDFSQTVTALTDNGQNQAYLFMVDEYIFSWYVKIKDGLADGETGSTYTMPGFWKCNDYDPTVAKQTAWNGRSGNFSVAVRPEGATADDDYNFLMSATKNSFVNYGVYEHVLWDDLEHTFTIGENPNSGSGTTTTKYAVTFLENDGTEISAKEYADNAAVAVPEAVENQLGWADASTGKLVDLEGYVATKKAEFKRVLTTDKFDITISLAGGTVDEAALPENAKVENGSLIVKAGLGEEVDLSTLPAPEKTGYTGEWNPATVTLDSTKGASASVKWTPKTYTVKVYNAEGDAEPIEEVTVAYNATATTRNAVAPEGMKFAGWADAATGETVSTAASFKYTYDEDKSFYAVWTAYDSSITIMVRDYEAGEGWQVGAVSYNDAGKTLNKSNTQALLEKAAASIDATIATLPGTTMVYIYDNAETTGTLVDISSGLKYNGATTYYLCTTLDFNVTWKVPVLDADGAVVDYKETTSTASTGATANAFSVNVKTNADTTAPAGYTFKGWVLESTGEAINYNENIGVTLDYTYDRDVAFVAEFAETEYEIVFDAQSGSADGKITIDDKNRYSEALEQKRQDLRREIDKLERNQHKRLQ